MSSTGANGSSTVISGTGFVGGKTLPLAASGREEPVERLALVAELDAGRGFLMSLVVVFSENVPAAI
jgi:hypothetical protein